MPTTRLFKASGQGALVISLDFELHWGVRDHQALDAPERKRLLRARAVIPKVLAAFAEHQIRATWATVGLLFARSREEAQDCRPSRMPNYHRDALDPYRQELGRDEADDPFHFAPSLIRYISQQPGQELASHSYSHFYPLEHGQGEAEFEADLASARKIARNSGYGLKSFVFPRNQVRGSYLPILGAAGFTAYRGTELAASKAAVSFRQQRNPWSRALRLLDAYCDLDGPQIVDWPAQDGCSNLPVPVDASRYLRPYLPSLRALESARLRRIKNAMLRAAQEKKIFHLWWHPEDFAVHPERNLDFLYLVLAAFDRLRQQFGMVSLSMSDVSESVNPDVSGADGLLKMAAVLAR